MQLISSSLSAYAQPMTAEQLRHLGTREVVYLRYGMRHGVPAVLIYGADGTPLAAADTVESAVAQVFENELQIVAVH